MMLIDLAANALASGAALGSIYALLAMGLAITFGLLHVPNVAHPAIVVAGAYAVALANGYGADPLLAALLLTVPFYVLGLGFYTFYSRAFELRGRGNSLQSLTLFFGVALVIEIGLVIAFGTDLRSVSVPYVGQSLSVGFVTLPYRFLVPALVTPAVILALWLYLTRTHGGLALRAVAHDERALSISGIDPSSVKRHAFGLATALAVLAGAALIITGPVDPFTDRSLLGRVFAVVVLAGLGSIPGTLVAAVLIGVAEAFVTTFVSPSWAPGVAFAILLGTLGLRPSGLFGASR
ncbi:branched-chain amino acid ABC transporter permease [Arenibaculum pallidiluteum]|uniref:branched-chain amino acid ABC transporter permease n=1 Tax=Arenibaculum pallidiluteum TaxID=2812559 RepID=UPI001A95C23E|nr:branched-chain amino acid ABC transporter permease [Arenibaculum pallidiluteum]